MLGRRHLRRRHALPHRGSVGAAVAGARGGAQSVAADASARRQWRRLHQLSRQCRAAFRQTGGSRRHRPVPCLRLPELGREHARRHGCGRRRGQAGRSGDLLHRRHPRSGASQIRPQILCRAGQGIAGGRRAYHRGQGHGRAAEAELLRACCSRRCARRPTCRSISTPTTRQACRRRRCWRRWRAASTPSTRRWIRSPATPRSHAWARSSRR